MQHQPSLADATDRLEHNALFSGVLVAVVVGAALMLVQPLVALGVALVISIGWIVFIRSWMLGAPGRLLEDLGAVRLKPGSQPRLENLVEGLCVTSGVAAPEVLILSGSTMNALVVAGREGARLVLTASLVEGLGRLELEGVLANLLGRVRDGSARYSTTVVGLFGSSSRSRKLLAGRLGKQRSVLSDLAAVDLTRYPPGLIAGLSAMVDTGTTIEGAPSALAPLWFAPVEATSEISTVGPQTLPLRIAVLAEL